jgi:hypothetical protein
MFQQPGMKALPYGEGLRHGDALFGVARRRQRGNVFVCRRLGTAFALRL